MVLMRLSFLLLCACCLAFASPEVDEAAYHNLALSGALLGAQNPCGAAVRQPTQEDPSYSAGVKIVTAIPQVGNVTSDLSLPKVLWAWFASYPSSISLSKPSGNGCPDSVLNLYAKSGPHLANAKLVYGYGENFREAPLSETGPNPVPLDLNGSFLSGSELAGLYAPLSLRLSGEIGMEYAYSKTDYVMECSSQESGSGCACVERSTVGVTEYRGQHSDSMDLLVETGPVQEVWLSPPLQKRLEGNQTGELLVFARRMPARITFLVDGRLYGENLPYLFEKRPGECGSLAVDATLAPVDRGVAVQEKSEVLTSQLVDEQAVYKPIYAKFEWSEAAGGKGAEVRYEDWFSNAVYFKSNFSVRNPGAFAGNGGELAMGVRQGNGSVSPAAYPAQEIAGGAPRLTPIAALLCLLIIAAVHHLFVRMRNGRL